MDYKGTLLGAQVFIILKILCLEYLCQVAHLVMSVCTSFTCEQSCKCDVYLGEAGVCGICMGGSPFWRWTWCLSGYRMDRG